MIALVPYLIDGNNLMFALSEVHGEVGRQGLCRLLCDLAAAAQRVHVVFDGPPPDGPANQGDQTSLTVDYAGGRTADAIILEHIAAESAPRRLTVVSTDREIRKAARRRRCGVQTSEQFARMLLRVIQAKRTAKSRRADEPKEKRSGLNDQQTRNWLREFGLEE